MKRYSTYLLVVAIILGTLQVPAVQAFMGRVVGGGLQGNAGHVTTQPASANGTAPAVYYPFDGDANNTVLTARNDLSVVGTATQPAGKIGHAVGLNNLLDYGLASSSSDFTMSNTSFTIGAWVYLSSLPSESVVVSKYTSDSGPREYVLEYSGGASGHFVFYLYDSNNNFTGVTSTVAGATSQWYYVMGGLDLANSQIFVSVNNTTTTQSTSMTGWSPGSPATFRIGSRNSTSPIGFQGNIDEVGVWRRMLDASERTALYNSGNGLAYSNLSNSLKKNLVSYYAFEEASGSRLDSHVHSSYTSTINGNTALTMGKYGQAYSFDGSGDYIETNYPGVSGNGARSISAWVYYTAGTTSYLMGYGNNNSAGGGAFGGYTRFDVSIENGSVVLRVNGFNRTWSSPAVTGGRWTHLALVYPSGANLNSSSLKLYVNGVDAGAGVSTGANTLVTAAGTTIKIGADSGATTGTNVGTPTGFFNGKIDDFRFYDTELTAGQVAQLFGGSNPPNCDQTCAGWWKLDEASGSLADSSGNSRTGTNSGATANAEGIYRGAYTFDGSTSTITTGVKFVDVNGNFTASAWIYPTTLNGSSSTIYGVMSEDNDSSNKAWSLYVLGDGKLVYGQYNGTAGNALSSPAGQITTNVWQHVVLTRTPSAVTMYVNGRSVTLSPNSTPTDVQLGGLGSPTFRIGVYRTDEFAGRIDDVRIYSRALDASEVADQYLAGKPN